MVEAVADTVMPSKAYGERSSGIRDLQNEFPLQSWRADQSDETCHTGLALRNGTQDPMVEAVADTVMPSKAYGEFSLRNVTFVYPARPETLALDDVSIFLPAGGSKRSNGWSSMKISPPSG
jgi:hypothetical protein